MSFISLFRRSEGIAPRIRCMKNLCFKVFLAVVSVSSLAFSAPSLESSPEIVKPVHHYEVSVQLDVPLALGIALTSSFGVYRYYGMEKVSAEKMKPKSELLPWDRPFAGRYSEWATTVSHYSSALVVAPFLVSGYSWYRGDADAYDFGAYALTFIEALALQNALNQIFRSTELWPRPYMYSKSGKGAEKANEARAEAYGSFYSGHASAAFTVAVFTGEWFSEIYPNSKYKALVWASSLSMAGLVGALRVVAGKHYPTDVVVGALVGTGISLGILKMHEICKKKISFVPIPGGIHAIMFF